MNFNDLSTRDPEAAKAFYGAVFGWTTSRFVPENRDLEPAGPATSASSG